MIERIRELLGAVSFHRGLALGALVGSAIAGSTIWSRIRESRQVRAGDSRTRLMPPQRSDDERRDARDRSSPVAR